MGKRKKSFYKIHDNKKQKYAPQLQAEMRGFLVTFPRGRDKQVKAEVFELLNAYHDKLLGICSEKEEVSDQDSDDIETALHKQVQQLKEERREEPFKSVDPGVNNTLFMRCSLETPSDLIYPIIADALGGRVKSRFILRMIPIDGSCKPEKSKIEACLKQVFTTFCAKIFGEGKSSTFKTDVKITYNTEVKRDSLIELVGQVMKEIFPLWSVDLKNPRVWIQLNVLKNVCCISVLKDYVANKKFNIQELSIGETPAAKSLDQVTAKAENSDLLDGQASCVFENAKENACLESRDVGEPVCKPGAEGNQSSGNPQLPAVEPVSVP